MIRPPYHGLQWYLTELTCRRSGGSTRLGRGGGLRWVQRRWASHQRHSCRRLRCGVSALRCRTAAPTADHCMSLSPTAAPGASVHRPVPKTVAPLNNLLMNRIDSVQHLEPSELNFFRFSTNFMSYPCLTLIESLKGLTFPVADCDDREP